jgi:hypothetical protein
VKTRVSYQLVDWLSASLVGSELTVSQSMTPKDSEYSF